MMRPAIPRNTARATAAQIERYIRGHQDIKEVISKRTPKQQERLRTKHPGRSARDYMDPEQTQNYLASLRAVERLAEVTRHQSITKGINPFLELRRCLKNDFTDQLKDPV